MTARRRYTFWIDLALLALFSDDIEWLGVYGAPKPFCNACPTFVVTVRTSRQWHPSGTWNL